MTGAILIYSCQKYKESRIRELSHLKPEYSGWKVFFFVGDPNIKEEYTIDGNIITLRCEDSYLHLLKKTILGFKVAIDILPNLTGILKCGDDIVFNESELLRFIRDEQKYDYMGIQGSPFMVPNGKHYDSWIVDYYRKHPEDFQNPYHGLPGMDVVKGLTEVPNIQAASGPLTYFSRRSCDILIDHMNRIQWNILEYSPKFGYVYIIEEPGISFILYPFDIYPKQYRTFTESKSEFERLPFIGLHTNSYKWTSPIRVCILGAGWYGCHAARFLMSKGCYVHILDKSGIFSGASSKNQNRLHLGYHYPRSEETIRECKLGHRKFIEQYGDCVVSFPDNLYFIHKHSKTNIDQFRQQYNEHVEIDTPFVAHNVEQRVFAVQEKFIDNVVARTRMERELSDSLELCDSPCIEVSESHVRVNGIEYDYVLNCTNNQYVPIPIPFNPIYETVCSLLYEFDFKRPCGITVMDGPFFSIFPYDMKNNIYTVTHVDHGVVSRGSSLCDPVVSIDTVRSKIEQEMFGMFPELQSKCKYVGYFLSKKTKYDYEKDDRSLRWFSNGRYLSFSGGKITGIFEMEQTLLDKVINAGKINI